MKLLLVGAGHSMIAVLKRARKWVARGVDITLLNDHPFLFYSGMTPEYLGGVYATDEVRVDLKAWCEYAGINWVQGWATRFDLSQRAVHTSEGDILAAEVMAFNIGAETPVPDEAGGISTKPLHRLERLKRRLDNLRHAGDPLDLVISGGGAAGVEIALNISGQFGGAATGSRVRIAVVEPADRLLPMFPKGMGRYAEKLLTDRGVQIRVGDEVTARDTGEALLGSGRRIAATEVLWATGSAGPSLFGEAGLDCSEEEFVQVDRTLRHRKYSWLFAAGDCAAVDGYEHLRRIGVHAVKQGPLLANNLQRVLLEEDGQLGRFRPYPVAPLILSTGTDEGLWVAGNLWLRGRLMLRLKHLVDINWMDRARHPGSKRRPLPERWHARHAGARVE